MRLFDAHNHLHDDRFGDRADELIAACRRAGVERAVVNGSCESDWPAVARLARRHPDFVLPAFGLHPWYVHERTTEWESALRRHLEQTPGATVGEIGLDRWILDTPPRARAAVAPGLDTLKAAPLAEQEEVFAIQMRLAAEMNLPATIHCLQAWGALLRILGDVPGPARGFILHSYGGSAELVEPLARLGAHFSFPGYFLHVRKARQREAFRRVPPDRLLAETDAPDQRLPARDELDEVAPQVPEPLALRDPGGRAINHPANLPAVYRGLAAVRDEPLDGMTARIAENFTRLFGGSPARG